MLPPSNRPALSLTLTALLCLSGLGCHREEVPARPSASDAALHTPQDSVAAPTSALPTPDAAMAPQRPAPDSARTDAKTDASGPSQASPDHMTKEQESSAMPLAGQANNHSTPAPTAPGAASDQPTTAPAR